MYYETTQENILDFFDHIAYYPTYILLISIVIPIQSIMGRIYYDIEVSSKESESTTELPY